MNKLLSNKRQLIIINKLLIYSLLLFFVYVFISGLLGTPAHQSSTTYSTSIVLDDIKPGEYKIQSYRTEMIFILHRTEDMLDSLKQNNSALVDPLSHNSQQPIHSQNLYRSQLPEYLIVHAYDPDSGCTIAMNTSGNHKGLHDLCSGNRYDWAGRAISPARVNLSIPSYDLSQQLDDAANNQ